MALEAATKTEHQCSKKLANSSKFFTWMCLHALLQLVFSGIASSSSIVETLPGYPGTLPFKLETGYVGVGEMEDVQLFYYFVESQRQPLKDPLLLWLPGGPGCSALATFFFGFGPLSFDVSNYTSGLPILHLNPFTWNQGLNIIYLDSPAGTGFSYANTTEGYNSGDLRSAAQTYEFIKKWLVDHPEFLSNQLFIGGEPYSGLIVPMVVQEILHGINAGLKPVMNLKGYVLGNPKTDSFFDSNAKVPFAHRLTLISDGLYQAAKTSCNGNYVNMDSSNDECETALQTITKLISKVDLHHILEPTCSLASPEPNVMEGDKRFLNENSQDFLISQSQDSALWCTNYDYELSNIWANDESVQEALQVRNGTIDIWRRCNNSLSYTKDVLSSVAYHRNISEKSLVALIYSGDHDMSMPHIGTQNWIKSLNLAASKYWQPWFVDGQVAGYMETYVRNDFTLTFATMKGAGHVAQEYKAKECYAMINRWFAYFPL